MKLVGTKIKNLFPNIRGMEYSTRGRRQLIINVGEEAFKAISKVNKGTVNPILKAGSYSCNFIFWGHTVKYREDLRELYTIEVD